MIDKKCSTLDQHKKRFMSDWDILLIKPIYDISCLFLFTVRREFNDWLAHNFMG